MRSDNGVEFYLNLLSILTFTSYDDLQRLKETEESIFQDVLNQAQVKGNNTLHKPIPFPKLQQNPLHQAPSGKILLNPLIFIKHVEQIDDHNEMMNIHGTLVLYWQDLRWAWNASEYANIRQFSRLSSEMENVLWMPRLNFWDVYHARYDRKLVDRPIDREARLTINSNGILSPVPRGRLTLAEPYARRSSTLSLRVGCHIDASEFPFDQQNCSFLMGESSGFTVFKLEFDRQLQRLPQLQMVNLEKEEKKLLSGTFFVQNMESQPSNWAFGEVVPDSYFEINNDTNKLKHHLFHIEGVMKYKIVFKRHVPYYSATMIGPLLVFAVLILVLAYSTNKVHNFHFLLVLLVCQVLFGCYLEKALPITYSQPPDIVVFAIVAVLLNMFTILLKAVPIYFNSQKGGELKWRKIREHTVAVTVLLPVIYLSTLIVHIFNWWIRYYE